MAINKVTTDVIDMSGNTGGLVWAKGATGDQPLPVNSTAGDLRENTTTGKTEVFNGTEWRNLKEASATIAVDYLVVAGGAGGAGSDSAGEGAGGGGAGGCRTSFDDVTVSALSLTAGPDYTVEVGPGGAAGTNSPRTNGGNGINSVFHTITSTGGGGGGFNAGNDGGSGGGTPYSDLSAGQGNTPSVSPSQGSDGGLGSSTVRQRTSGGGGGAGQAGQTGDGGDGIEVNIIGGTGNYYAGGGAGGNGGGAGGLGGGATALNNGTPNTGGGGGGGNNNQSGGSGGSGIVILRYPNTYSINVGAGLFTGVLNQAVGVGEKYTTFTAGTGTITFS